MNASGKVYLLLIFCFLWCNSGLLAQDVCGNQEMVVSGTITDVNTNKPIPHVEVFISGTTRGCISNSSGKYSLKLPFAPCTLVAEHVSYNSFVKNIEGGTGELNIGLTPKNVSIGEVKVMGKSNRKRNLKYFYSHFTNKDRSKIKILNDSVLYFKMDKYEFSAFTNEPLIVVNKNLGYKIKVTIKEFGVKRIKYPDRISLPLKSSQGYEFVHVIGYYYYQELEATPIEQEVYKRNREQHYFGSTRHLLKSVYDDDLAKQGFELKTYPQKSGSMYGLREVKSLGENRGLKNFIIHGDSLQVTYTFDKNRQPFNKASNNSPYYKSETSTIRRTNSTFTVRENGKSTNAILDISGPLTRGSNMANSLPDNYFPTLK
jgi:hypothetical protein